MRQLTKDSNLNTIDQMSNRIKSIQAQIDKLSSDVNDRTFRTRQTKIEKLSDRLEKLWYKRAKSLKQNTQ